MHHNYNCYVSCFSVFVKDKWQMSPILVHDKRSMINPGRLELDGSARTIILECTASIQSKDSSVAVAYFNLSVIRSFLMKNPTLNMQD